MTVFEAYGFLPGSFVWLAGRFPRGSPARRTLNRAAPRVYRAREWLVLRASAAPGRALNRAAPRVFEAWESWWYGRRPTYADGLILVEVDAEGNVFSYQWDRPGYSADLP